MALKLGLLTGSDAAASALQAAVIDGFGAVMLYGAVTVWLTAAASWAVLHKPRDTAAASTVRV